MNINAQNLLKNNLKTMHSQTKQWIEEVEFYKEELEFFNSLISNRIDTVTKENLDHREIYRNIDVLLYKLSEHLIRQIKIHKKELSLLIDTGNISENHEESKDHLRLLEKMERIKSGIKKLKKALFRYLKDHPFDFDFDTIIKEL